MRKVLVTGASGGIGAAVARRFAEAGDRVGVHYTTNRDGAESTMRSLRGDGRVLVSGETVRAMARAPCLHYVQAIEGDRG